MTRLGRFSLPLVRPLETAAGAIDRREGFLIRVGDEPAGLGEATPLPGWTESLDACRQALDAASPAGDTLPTTDDLPDVAEAPAARHGLELALFDRAARDAAVPLYRLLGGARRVGSLPVNATVGDGDGAETVAACRAAVERGFETVKLKVGAGSLEADLDRVAAARDAVGDDVELRVDANGAWTADVAETAVERLASLDVAVVEQPLPADALDEHAALRGRGVDVALDESLRAADAGVEAVLDAGAADVLVLKPMVLGGLGPAVAAAERAAEAGVDVIATTTVDAAVARTAAVHLAAAVGTRRACGLATATWLARDVADDPADVVDGAISVPQSAGHGVGVEALR